jgi:hypothetical protein
LLPRRVLVVGVPVLLLALGAAASVSASRFIVTQSRLVQYLTIGPDKTWIDDNANGSVTYLYSGQANWEIPWQAMFWNREFDSAGRFLGVPFPGGMPAPSVGPNADGTLVNDLSGAHLQADYVVTSREFAMAGTEIMRPRPDTILWRVDQPPRLMRWLEGVAYEGLVANGRARLYVYACNGGTMRGYLSADVASVVSVRRNNIPYKSFPLEPGQTTHFQIPVGQPNTPGEACIVEFDAPGPFSMRELGFS